MNALLVVTRTPEDDFDLDAEPADRFGPSVGGPRRRGTTYRSRARLVSHRDLAEPHAMPTVEIPVRLMRPVRLLCRDHALTSAEPSGLAGGVRESRLVENLIHTVWRAGRLPRGTLPADEFWPPDFG